mgnify:CR=1 FL=1
MPSTFTEVELTNGDLAFGQVMPVVLLAASLLIILEYFNSVKFEVGTTLVIFLMVNLSRIRARHSGADGNHISHKHYLACRSTM